MSAGKVCRDCKFYFREEENDRETIDYQYLHKDDYFAECRRYPPNRFDAKYYGEIGQTGIMNEAFGWPSVNCLAWCGEWHQRGII